MSIQEYGRAGEAAAPSPSIWKDFPAAQAMKTPGRYIHIWDDFEGNFTADDVQNVGSNQWLVAGTNPDTAIVADEVSVVNLSGSGAGNDECVIGSGVVQNELIKKNSGLRCWLEARVKMDDVSADVSFLFGLGAVELIAADFIDNEGATRNDTADYDFIGFHTDNDGSNQGDMETCYNQSGDGSLTAVQAAVRSFGATTTYDDTYMKLGLRFDGKQTVTFYLDGVQLGTQLDIDDLTSDKLDAPLCVILGIKDFAGGTDDLKVDWIRYACEKYASGI